VLIDLSATFFAFSYAFPYIQTLTTRFGELQKN